jgi:hypothetical protein
VGGPSSVQTDLERSPLCTTIFFARACRRKVRNENLGLTADDRCAVLAVPLLPMSGKLQLNLTFGRWLA